MYNIFIKSSHRKTVVSGATEVPVTITLLRNWVKPSRECLEDVLNLTVTFPIVCSRFLQEFPGAGFYCNRFNSDIVENNFCQARGLRNGDLTHPTYATYQASVNSIILGQSSVSAMKNSNAKRCKPDPFKKSAVLSVKFK